MGDTAGREGKTRGIKAGGGKKKNKEKTNPNNNNKKTQSDLPIVLNNRKGCFSNSALQERQGTCVGENKERGGGKNK